MISKDQWIGFYLIFFNVMYIWNTKCYYRWWHEDAVETRDALRRSYLYILIQGYIAYIGLFIIVYYIPSSTLPDRYEDSMGNEYEFPPEKKEDMKKFALYFIAVFAFFYCWINCYVYYVVKRWASKESIIEYAKMKRV